MKILKNELDGLTNEFAYQMTSIADDERVNVYGNYYLFLESHIDQILEKHREIVREDILYSMYYWITYYLVANEKQNGPDAGVEQMRFKLLERMSEVEGLDMQWDVLEIMEEEIASLMKWLI